MADSSEASPQSPQVSLLSTHNLSNSEYMQMVEDLSTETINIHRSMLALEEENAKLVLKNQVLEVKNQELELVVVSVEDLKQKKMNIWKIRSNAIMKLRLLLGNKLLN